MTRWIPGQDRPAYSPQVIREASGNRTGAAPSIASRRTSVLVQSVAVVLALCIVFQVAIGDVNVQAQAPLTEYSAKAASLALLPDYVKWPAPTGSALTVGILGEDLFGGALDKLKPKRAKRIEDLKDCQIIFVAKSEQAKVAAILDALAGANVLTVGESEGFAKSGGVIGFVIEENQVRFEVNTGAARQAGLKLDLRLLKLAVRVFNS